MPPPNPSYPDPSRRLERTAGALAKLRLEVEGWFKQIEQRDQDRGKPGVHATQQNVLRLRLERFLDNLNGRLGGLAGVATGDVYTACTAIDAATGWVRRLWDYYRRRFDQRQDDLLGPLLDAADEVVWSLFAPAFPNEKSRPPAPLCTIDPTAQPWARESHRPLPPEVSNDSQATVLDVYLRTVPIPLLGMPAWVVDSPWWLVYLGHEVGHHVQRDADLVVKWADWLDSVSGRPSWGNRGEEVFADVFSVLALGGWAAFALADAVWASPSSMIRASERYPAPVVRIELTARLAEKLAYRLPPDLAPFRWNAWRADAEKDPR